MIDATFITDLYTNPQKCAQAAGLEYTSGEALGLTRRRAGKGWSFTDESGTKVSDEVKERILELAIPPAWQQVWICPTDHGHILATGVDDKGRKQYIYHPKWRRMRDMLNFYRLLVFGEQLLKLRRYVAGQLTRDELDDSQIYALMAWLLDNAYLRIGNETYFEENETVGLATIARQHVALKPPHIALDFTGKSSQTHHIELEDQRVAELLAILCTRPSDRLFVRADGTPYTAAECNAFLHDFLGEYISAKSFRTWGGTVAAYSYLKQHREDEGTKKRIIEAIDEAADTLGNTRAVAKAHYVHPHVLNLFLEENFTDYYQKIKKAKRAGLSKDEAEVLKLLELLVEDELASKLKAM